jgi:hypothetical protein
MGRQTAQGVSLVVDRESICSMVLKEMLALRVEFRYGLTCYSIFIEGSSEGKRSAKGSAAPGRPWERTRDHDHLFGRSRKFQWSCTGPAHTNVHYKTV